MQLFRQKHNGKPHRKWTIQFTDHLGTRRKIAAFPDKAASAAMGHKLEKLVAFRAACRTPDQELSEWLESLPPRMMKRLSAIGLVDGESAAAAKPLMRATKGKGKQSSYLTFTITGGHLADFRCHMEARELKARHISQVISHCARLIDARRWAFPTDISTDGIENYLASLREGGASARTANAALAAVKTFCNWMRKEGRLTVNPAARVGKLNERADRRLIRRALTTGEARRLLVACEAGEDHHGMTGHERALVYRLALGTGLRLGEIRALRRADFQLASDPATVHIRAESEKAGRGDTLPLRPELARDLDAYFGERLAMPGASAFPSLASKGAEMLRADLDAAGVDWTADESGAILDFHSLRHTFGTMLAASGVHPKTCQDLMRHATIDLTMNLYTHTVIGDRAKATASLPDFTRAPNEERKTGTADLDESTGAEGLEKEAQKQAQKQAHDWQQSAFSGQIRAVENGNAANPQTPVKSPGTAHAGHSGAELVGAGEGGRTLDIQLGKLTLETHKQQDGKPLQDSPEKQALQQAQNDPALATLIANWPTLPAHIRAAIVALAGK